MSYHGAGSVRQQAHNDHGTYHPLAPHDESHSDVPGAGSRQQKPQDPCVAYQHVVSAPEDSGPEASRIMKPRTKPQHTRAEQNDSGSEPVHKPRGTSQQPSAQDDAGSDHAGGSQSQDCKKTATGLDQDSNGLDLQSWPFSFEIRRPQKDRLWWTGLVG